MSITAYTFNNFIHDGYSPYWIQVGSTNSTKLNYSMGFYCRIGRWNPTEDVATFYIKPDNNGVIAFNPQKVLSSYLYTSCHPTTTGWTATEQAAATFMIYFGERYDNTTVGNTPTGVTQYSFSSSTGIHNLVNSYENPEDGFQLSGICDVYGIVQYHKLCTDWDEDYYYPIGRTEWMSLSYYQRAQTWDTDWNLITYDVSGNTIGQYTLPATESSTTWKMSYQLPSGTNNFSHSGYNYYTSAITSNMMSNSVHYYDLYCSHSGTPTVRTSVIYKYRITDDCEPYSLYRIAWLNHWGGYDYWTFPLKNRVKVDRKNNEWEKFRNYDFVSGDNTRKNLNVELKKQITLTSNWITQNESEYLFNLFKSTEIYIVQSDGSLIPVQMVDTSTEYRTKINDRIINYSFTLEYTYGILPQTT